jgi:MerR family transcriptional regulator, mercuric resistance operon regulatory protein
MWSKLSPTAGRKAEAASAGKGWTRGALAARTGCNIETIRYYEKIGLLPPPPRSVGGHRIYGRDLVKRLNFVRRSRDLGFTLEEIRELLRLVDGGTHTCGEVEQLARDHVREIRRKIADLRRLQRVLETMAARCSGGAIPDCPIIDALLDLDGLSRQATAHLRLPQTASHQPDGGG